MTAAEMRQRIHSNQASKKPKAPKRKPRPQVPPTTVTLPLDHPAALALDDKARAAGKTLQMFIWDLVMNAAREPLTASQRSRLKVLDKADTLTAARSMTAARKARTNGARK
jgi:hypothetical protein